MICSEKELGISEDHEGVIILEDDAPCLSISNVVVQELPGGPADAAFLVTLDHPSTLPISVDFSTLDSSAIVVNDYLGRSGSLVFSNGITSQSIHVQVNNDLEVEVNEN